MTIQKLAKAEATNNTEQFEALFNNATIGIIITGKNGKIINFNRYAETQFGYFKDEIIGKSLKTLIPTQNKAGEKCENNFFDLLNDDNNKELYGQKKDGSSFPVEVSISNYTIKNEAFIMAFIIDTTVRKKNELALLNKKSELEKITLKVKKLNTELEQKVADRTKMLRETLSALERSKEELSETLQNEKELGELKSRFVTMASHEFRTPLSAILSSTFLLEKYNEISEGDKRIKHLQRIRGAVSDMKAILEDFLSLGKLNEGLIKASIEDVTANDLFSYVENILNEMVPHFKHGQCIHFEYNGKKSVQIDKQLFKNILTNLLLNAIKFSPDKSAIKVNINISADELYFSIKDEGIGISEEDQQHLFKRFYRAKNAANIQGTGLGLHIVSKYLDLINGTIELESTINKGSTFIIHIPQPILQTHSHL